MSSLLIYEGQQEVRQNLSNDENGFENLFPLMNFIKPLKRSDVEDVHRLFDSSFEDSNKSRGRTVFQQKY